MAVSLQKADVWKRISAYFFDIMLALVVAVASTLFFLAISKYDAHYEKIEQIRARYEQEYDINLNITQEEYNAFSESEKLAYDEKYQALNKALTEDKELTSTYANLIITIVVSASLGLLVGNAVIFFIAPLFFKNGQTLGKKCFGLAVVRTNAVKMSTPILFIRCFVGRFAIETMFPIFLITMTLLGLLAGSLGLITLVLFLLLDIGAMIYSPINSSIHDLISDTVVVDMSSQAIFESYDELIEYEKAEALKKANEEKSV